MWLHDPLVGDQTGAFGAISSVGLKDEHPQGANVKIEPSSRSPEVPVSNTKQSTSNSSSGKYSNLKEPKKVGDGLKTTTAQRARILEANKAANGGVIKSDISGKTLDQPALTKKGEKANMNQAEIDHVKQRSKGGSNSNSNLQVTSKKENLDKRE